MVTVQRRPRKGKNENELIESRRLKCHVQRDNTSVQGGIGFLQEGLYTGKVHKTTTIIRRNARYEQDQGDDMDEGRIHLLQEWLYMEKVDKTTMIVCGSARYEHDG